MLIADAEIISHRTYEDLPDGGTFVHETWEWKSGRVAEISLYALAGTDSSIDELRKLHRGDKIPFAGYQCKVIGALSEWSNSFYLVRVLDIWGQLYAIWYRLTNNMVMWRIRDLLWRTAWAWYLLDIHQSDLPTWNRFRPYRWLKRLRRSRRVEGDRAGEVGR